jgi:RNA polymerase sigma-70 factor (ECF subfamily)
VTSSRGEPTDADLVAQMVSGDRDAFAALYRRHQATVYRFSRQMLGSKEAAEDVTQEVFMALARNAPRYQPSLGSLSTYLYGITRNMVFQRHKRTRSRAEVDVADLNDQESRALAISIDPLGDLSRAQAIHELRLEILRLPVHYREAIVLCELNGRSYEEAASIVRCPVGTIRSRLSRAKALLAERCRAAMHGREVTEVWKPCLTPTKNGC